MVNQMLISSEAPFCNQLLNFTEINNSLEQAPSVFFRRKEGDEEKGGSLM